MAYIATLDDKTHKIEVQELEEDHLYRIVIDGNEHIIDGRKLTGHIYSLLMDNRSFTVDVSAKDDQYTVACEGKSIQLRLLDERRALRPGEGSGSGRDGGKLVKSFMPGKVVEVLVKVGDDVEKDQGLIIIEAMKMENELRSTAAGKVKEIRVSPGQAVESGELLIELE
ncbi:MAG: biotin/lipoyl-binding protein [Deltaproteobacteria bacterium]|nr:biotin/lipoyl-binding protein [Deltaproteobacteria bacterium]